MWCKKESLSRMTKRCSPFFLSINLLCLFLTPFWKRGGVMSLMTIKHRFTALIASLKSRIRCHASQKLLHSSSLYFQYSFPTLCIRSCVLFSDVHSLISSNKRCTTEEIKLHIFVLRNN